MDQCTGVVNEVTTKMSILPNAWDTVYGFRLKGASNLKTMRQL